MPSTATIESQPRDRLLIALILVVVFALCDFAIAPAVFLGDLFFGLSVIWLAMGLVGAQGSSLAVWSVLGPGSQWMRHGVEWAIGTLWLCAWAAGCLVAAATNVEIPALFNAVWLAFFAPAVYLAAQLPLWLMRSAFRWRVEFAGTEHRGAAPPLTVANLMLFTAMVAVSLAAARAGIWLSGIQDSDSPWLSLGIWMASAAIISFMTTVPAVIFILGPPSLKMGIAMFAGFGMLALLTVGIGLSILSTSPPDLFLLPLILLILILPFSGHFGGLAAPLSLARAMGYRLAWGRPSSRVN